MYFVSQVDNGRALWKRDHITLGRKKVDLGCIKIKLEVVNKFRSIGIRRFKMFTYPPYPCFKFVFKSTDVLIPVMCCKAMFSNFIHAFGPYLYFNPFPLWPHNCYM